MATVPVTPAPAKGPDFLSKLGTWFKEKFDPAAKTVIEVGTEVAEVAEPFIDVAVPSIAALYKSTLALVVQAESAGTAAAASATTNAAKLDSVTQALEPIAIPFLTSIGVSNPTTAQIQAYINTVVAGLRVFEALPVATAGTTVSSATTA